MRGDDSVSEFSGLAGRILAGTMTADSLGSGVALGLLLVVVSAGLIAASAHSLVLPFFLVVCGAALSRFAVNGFFGEWRGSLFSSAGGAWTAAGTVALRYLALTLSWYAPLSVIGLPLAKESPSGMLKIVGGAGIVGALNVVALAVTPPPFLIVSVSAANVADVFSAEHWRRQFAGRIPDLLAVYAVYAGALWMLALLSLPLVSIALAIDGGLAAVVAGAAACLVFGVTVNLLGRLCGFFACATPQPIGAAEDEGAPGPAAPPRPPSRSERVAPAVQPVSSVAPAPAPRPAPAAEPARRPALLAARQRVDEALRGAEEDAAGALARLREIDTAYAPNPLVLHAMARCAFDAGRIEEAVEAARRAIPLCIDRGQAAQAAEIFRELRKHRAEAGLAAEALLTIGGALIRMDDLAGAAKAFTAVVTADPGHTRAIKGLLQVADEVLHRKHNAEAAAKVYRLVLGTCPHSSLTEFARAGLEEAERAQAHPHSAS
jgi:hypothetical protein